MRIINYDKTIQSIDIAQQLPGVMVGGVEKLRSNQREWKYRNNSRSISSSREPGIANSIQP